jgi:hypothetical protein
MNAALPADNRVALSRGAVVSGIEIRRVGFGSPAQLHNSIRQGFWSRLQDNQRSGSAPTGLSESNLPSNELSHQLNNNTSHS